MMNVVLNNQNLNLIGSFHKIYYYDLAIAWSLPLHIIFKFFVLLLFLLNFVVVVVFVVKNSI